MLSCEGYKMFHGTVRITPVTLPNGTVWKEPFDLTGTWLFKPESEYWYCRPDDGSMTKSWWPGIMSNFRDDADVV